MQIDAIDPRAQSVHVERWPSEMPLFVTIFIVSVLLWIAVIVGTLGIGLIYVVIIGFFLFLAQAWFIAHVRGNAVRLGPDQFPELYSRVVEFASRAGLKRTPDAYLMQADGALNAFATKFFRRQMVVLYADLIDACGEDTKARDMIIGHEIGHLRSNHLEWNLVTAPGRFIPFLGSAYSRACEYTCDRWGTALCGDRQSAQRGLIALASGGSHRAKVNVEAFVRQQQDLDTGWMTLARWLGTYPPLAARVDAISDADSTIYRARKGPLRAWGIMLAFVLVPIAIVALIATIFATFVGTNDSMLRELGIEPGIEGAAQLPGFPDDLSSSGGGEASRDAVSRVDLPAATAIPQIDDPTLAGYAQSCSEGDMQACDDLYSQTPVDSPEETYGNDCGGRFPGNTLMCVDRVID
ncbi:M48 family metallopeptidase [Aureimonas mangrovi]|uniref:M48 family metallopeptidase n=1 Tax=Aureimonas mangrovi TaxID=2758041 RepID=UPI00163DCC44|nr:M48 family metallopeptidase [Aureimonas mangrovi]